MMITTIDVTTIDHHQHNHLHRSSVAPSGQATAAFSAMAQEMATEWQRAQRAVQDRGVKMVKVTGIAGGQHAVFFFQISWCFC